MKMHIMRQRILFMERGLVILAVFLICIKLGLNLPKACGMRPQIRVLRSWAYSPSEVVAQVGDGHEISIIEDTYYPMDDKIDLRSDYQIP